MQVRKKIAFTPYFHRILSFRSVRSAVLVCAVAFSRLLYHSMYLLLILSRLFVPRLCKDDTQHHKA